MIYFTPITDRHVRYRIDKLKLAGNAPAGDATTPTAVTVDTKGQIGLTYAVI